MNNTDNTIQNNSRINNNQGQVPDNSNKGNINGGNIQSNLPQQPYPYNPWTGQPQMQGQPVQNVQPYIPQQMQPQQPVSSSSPEVPARVEQGDRLYIPEKQEAAASKEKTQQKAETVKKEEKVVPPEQRPGQKKLEDPFKVLGYKASPNVTSLGSKLLDNKVLKDTSAARSWLIVLLGRLLRIYKGESYNPNA